MPIAPSPAVLRACDVLEHLAAHMTETFSVSELARSLDVPRATCDSVLLALAQHGLVHRSAERRYSLGAACRALGDAAAEAGAPIIAIEPIAEALARSASLCVVISSRYGDATRADAVFDHAPPFAIRARVGESAPLVPPFGAAFVAWDHDTAEAWLARAASAFDETEREHARRALAAVRARGYSVSTTSVRPELVQLLEDLAVATPERAALERRDALMRDVLPSRYLLLDIDRDHSQRLNQISAPVFDANRRVAHTLMVLGPSYDLQPDEIDALGAQLVAAANDATARIGGHHP
jgi:DNA-binding IclR family transcriptional regulator